MNSSPHSLFYTNDVIVEHLYLYNLKNIYIKKEVCQESDVLMGLKDVFEAP